MAGSEPTRIAGRYAVDRKLGSGAFGTVYLATDEVLGRQLAIKTVRLDALAATGAPLEELMQRFQREARVSAQLKHPNIVTIYDVGESEGLSYLAMEYIEGRGLEALIQSEGRLGPQRAAAIAAQVAEALSYAHGQGVVHRDVKPANIMIEAEDRVKVTDFGIAKAQTAENLTATGSLVGTPAYMSPEQARGGELDGRSDLFSLGCVLYEMLSGTRAFQADSITGLIFKVITEPPRPLKELAPDVPPELLAVVQRALSKAPETRFPDGIAMAEALRHAAGAAPPRPAPRAGSEDPTRVSRPRARAGTGTAPPRGVSSCARTLATGSGARRRPVPRPAEEKGGSVVPWILVAAATAVMVFALTRRGDEPEPEASAPAVAGTPTAVAEDRAATAAPPRGTVPAAPPPRIEATPYPTPVPPAPRQEPPPPRGAAPPGTPPPQTATATPPPTAIPPPRGAGGGGGAAPPWPPPPPGHAPPGGGPGDSSSEEARREEQPAMAALSRLSQAQARYFQQNGRYGTLVQLQRAGLVPRSTDASMRSLMRSYRLELVAGRSTWRAVARPRNNPKLRTFEIDQSGTVRAR